MSEKSNLKIDDNQLIISVNPKMYPLEAVYSAAYVFMDRAYIVLDGDPEKEIIVNMKLKNEGSLEELGNEFNNELLNYADYLARAKETKNIREMFLQRAIINNDPSAFTQEIQDDNLADLEELDNLDDQLDENSEDIAIPWEEKYGSKKEQDQNNENEDKTQ